MTDAISFGTPTLLWSLAGIVAFFILVYAVKLFLTPRPSREIQDLYDADRWDVFISYRRTRYAEQVRHVAEELIARNLRVWVDDYGLSRIDVRAKSTLVSTIEAVIEKANNAVIFETPDYEDSEFTRLERDAIRRRFSNTPKSVTIFKGTPPNDAATAARKIIRRCELVATRAPSRVHRTPTRKPDWYCDQHAGYRFDASGWESLNLLGRPGGPTSYKGPIMIRHGDSHKSRLITDIGLSASNSNATSRKWLRGDRPAIIRRALWGLLEGAPAAEILSPMAEKELWYAGYRFARSYARSALAIRRAILCGSHLFLLGGDYHFALTYWRHGLWTRRYSITAVDRLTDVRIEFAVAIEHEGALSDFCVAASEMDALVHSISWLPTGDSLSADSEFMQGLSAKQDAAALTNAAYLDIERGTVDAAMSKLILALSLADLGETHNEYATVCLLGARYEEAVEHILRAIQRDPRNARFWSCLARAYAEQKRPRAAIPCLLVARSLDPHYPVRFKASATHRRAAGDGARAGKESDEAVAERIVAQLKSLGPDDPLDIDSLEAMLR